MGGMIRPFQTQRDGDVLFAATTAEVENASIPLDALGMIASEAAYDAVMSCWPR